MPKLKRRDQAEPKPETKAEAKVSCVCTNCRRAFSWHQSDRGFCYWCENGLDCRPGAAAREEASKEAGKKSGGKGRCKAEAKGKGKTKAEAEAPEEMTRDQFRPVSGG